MGVRIKHPDIDREGVVATVEQFHAVYEGRGWELVPEGTPHPGEIPPVPTSDQLDMVPDDTTEETADKPPRSRRKQAADDAATDPED